MQAPDHSVGERHALVRRRSGCNIGTPVSTRARTDVGALDGEMQRHPTAEGVAEHDDRGSHVVEDIADQLGVGLGAPGGGGRRGRPETGEVEGERRQWRVARPRTTTASKSRWERAQPWRARTRGASDPVTEPNRRPVGKGAEHGVQVAPPHRGRPQGSADPDRPALVQPWAAPCD